jgi:hypothetical protein
MAKAARIILGYTVASRPFTDKGAPAKRPWAVLSPTGAVWRYATEARAKEIAAFMAQHAPDVHAEPHRAQTEA